MTTFVNRDGGVTIMEIQAHVHPDHTQMAKYAYNAHKVNTVRIRSYQAESVAMMGTMHSILE